MQRLFLLAILSCALIGCRSSYLPKNQSAWRGIVLSPEGNIETALISLGDRRWLVYEQSQDGLGYTLLSEQAGRLSAADSFSLAGLCHTGPAVDPAFLSVRVVNNAITQRPMFPAFVDAFAGDPMANVSGGKSDTAGLAQVPRTWKAKTAKREEPTSLAPVDTTPIQVKGQFNGRDTIFTIRPGRTRLSPVPDLGLAHTLVVKAQKIEYSFTLDTSQLKRDVVVSLGLHTRYSREPVALKLKKGKLLLTWGNRQRVLQASGVGIPAWCGWGTLSSGSARTIPK
jgi:hypothetical protein